jgi:hypothetical protein
VTGVHDDASGVRLHRSVGSLRPISAPASQTFWLASATGAGPLRVEWTPGDGRFAMVLANADGSVGVTGDVTVGAKVPILQPLGSGLLGGGVVAGLLALLLIYTGAVGLSGSGGRGTPIVRTPPKPPAPAPSGPESGTDSPDESGRKSVVLHHAS